MTSIKAECHVGQYLLFLPDFVGNKINNKKIFLELERENERVG